MIYVVGLGPGIIGMMSNLSIDAIKKSDVIVGYDKYVKQIAELIKDKEVFTNGMKGELDRVKKAIEYSNNGKLVSIVCGGDASLYALSSLVYEVSNSVNEIEVFPGITAALAVSARLGAPISDDLSIISMSDLLTPWDIIQKRIEAVNIGDFVCAIYNPKSKKRQFQLKYALDLFYKSRGNLLCGAIKNCFRENEDIKIMNIDEFDYDFIDMSTTVIVGNSYTYLKEGKLITPRGYLKNNQ